MREARRHRSSVDQTMPTGELHAAAKASPSVSAYARRRPFQRPIGAGWLRWGGEGGGDFLAEFFMTPRCSPTTLPHLKPKPMRLISQRELRRIAQPARSEFSKVYRLIQSLTTCAD